MKSNNKTLIAFAFVMLMLAVPLTAVAPSEDSDAASVVPAGANYAYLVTYSTVSDKTQSQITGVYKDSDISTKSSALTPVSHNDSWVYSSGSWTWSDTTGLGPFNMFYAAISVGNNASDKNAYSNTPGHIAHILKPSNLTKDIEGNTVTLANFNVMLVIPTIYWYSDGAGNLYISNTNTNSNLSSVNNLMKAYAHQVDDATIYPYLAIGVYEASVDSTYGLMSKTGVNPTASKTLSGFRAEVEKANSFVTDGAGTYQMWNFYEWTLYKIISQATIGNKNAQFVIGSGTSSGSGSSTAGSYSNDKGPYASSGTTTSGGSSYSKLYIENSWGSVWEFVDNTYVSGGKLKAGSGLTTGLYGTSDVLNSGISGADYTGGDLSVPAASNAPITSHVLTSAAWDMPATATGSGGSDYASGDNMWSNNSGNRCLFVGGPWSDGASGGLSAWASNNVLSVSNTGVGARLAYLMTADAAGSNTYRVSIQETSNNTDFTLNTYENVRVGSKMILPEADTLAGYSFEGWYSDENRTVRVGSAGQYYTPTADVSLYPKYTVTSYSLSVTNNSSTVIDVTYPSEIDVNGYALISISNKSGKYSEISSITCTGADCTKIADKVYQLSNPSGSVSVSITATELTAGGYKDFYIAGLTGSGNGMKVVIDSENEAGLLAGTVVIGGTYSVYDGTTVWYGAISSTSGTWASTSSTGGSPVNVNTTEYSDTWTLTPANAKIYYAYATYTTTAGESVSLAIMAPVQTS